MTATERQCLRNALRRTGRLIPPTAESIAAPLTDEELGRLIFDLQIVLSNRRTAA